MAFLGNVLTVDLCSGRWNSTPYPEAVQKRFLAGRGFAVQRLRDAVPPGTDPLGPGNVLVLAGGLLAATAAPASSRLHLCAVSPLTGLLGSANIGGAFAERLSGCGFQALVLTGRAPLPSILVIDSDGPHLTAAGSVWGADTWEAEERLKNRFSGRRTAVLVIGPAGENRVPLACIVSDRDHAAGRTGLGAVMGAKNLKAIVVCQGEGRLTKRSSRPQQAVSEYVRRIRQAPDFDFFSRYGGAGYSVWCSEQGFSGAYHYRFSRFAEADKIDGRRLAEDRQRSRGCPRCPVRCKAELRRAGRPAAFRPEFESMVNLGAKCGLADLDALVALDNLCTRLGLDVISAATGIAFAMELAERGMLPAALCNGEAPSWGDPAAMEQLIRQMSSSEGLGGLLGRGVREAAERIGPDARCLAAHVKGLELSAYHPGHLLGTALGYAVSSRGGDFNNIFAGMEYSWPAERGSRMFHTPASVDPRRPEGKGDLIRRASIMSCALDALGLCKVPALSLIGDYDLENEAKLVGALTGEPIGADELLEIGERIVNLERLLNLDYGLDPDRDDRLPEFFFSQATPGPEAPALTRDRFESMLQGYYAAMGWDRKGRPLPETLCRLALPMPGGTVPNRAGAPASGPGAPALPVDADFSTIFFDENGNRRLH